MIINVHGKRLSDGSCVYDVIVGNAVIMACSKSDAVEMAARMADLINRHSIDSAVAHVWPDPA